MTDQELDAYLELLRDHGWQVAPGDGGALTLDERFRRRYPRIPDGYLTFLRRVASCMNPDETVWFLCANDHNGTSDSAWAWDEFEKMLLEGADDEKQSEVARFWDAHLPFMYSVGGDYAYLAFRVTGNSFGSVVDGYDINMMNVSDVAPTFEDFLRLHSAAVMGNADDTILGDYV